ncbi:MAG: DUF3365 domain-containing protein [Myxococcales bacterium]|nr:DUF3365 domain-containing protein [Myxococcales bacterium]MCB9749554.1 DUF3365 domain-containing protein [Myxococcales bacterium]
MPTHAQPDAKDDANDVAQDVAQDDANRDARDDLRRARGAGVPAFLGLRTVAGKIIAPMLLAFVIGVAVMLMYIDASVRANAVASSEVSAQEMIQLFKLVRGYYTEAVVTKVRAHSELDVSYNHEGAARTIPLPATMIHDLSARLAGDHAAASQFRLYSAYPFPNREGRALDQFARDAIEAVDRAPDDLFVRVEQQGDHAVVRVAMADRMQHETCVNCHNAHPDTPKDDWRLGDVRGVLEVSTPIDGQLTAGKRMRARLTWLTVAICVLLASVVWLIVYFVVVAPLRQTDSHLTELADEEDLSKRLEIRERDEIGSLKRHVNYLVAALEQALGERDALNESLEQRVQERTAVAERQAAQIRALALTLTETEQRERRRLAEMLHDHLQQVLAAARLSVARLGRDSAESAAVVAETRDMLDQAISISRTLTVELSPTVLREDGLVDGLRWLAGYMHRTYDLEVSLDADPDAEPSASSLRVMLFQAVRELLFNVVKHGGVGEAQVTARTDGELLTIVVEDRGKGADLTRDERAAGVEHFGLSNLRSRLELVGGTLELVSEPGAGFRATVRVPLVTVA